jgi:two-component system, chemotaxis family, chemotaxis protein CheY
VTKIILTVDDSASMRQTIAFTLRGAGYEVAEAVDGKDALAALSRQQFNLIVTDLNMPNLDGIGLIKEVRKHATHKFVPIVMLTTESTDDKKQAGKAAGATGWIVKPFRGEQLVAIAKKLLGG